MTSTNVNQPISPNPLVTPVTESIDILTNIVEIGGISVIASERKSNCVTSFGGRYMD